MKIRMQKKEVSVIILFLIVVLVYLICIDIVGINTGSFDNLRYLVFAIAIVHGYLLLYLRGKLINARNNFGNTIQYIYIVAAFLYILSVIQARSVNRPLGIRTYIQIALILIPAMYSYVLVNLLDIRTITILIEITLVVNIIFYIFIDKGIFTFLDLYNYKLISFINSDSPFETSRNPDQFFACFAYLNFFRKTAKNEKEKRQHTFFFIVSILFVFLSFKRLAVVFTICMLLLNFFIDLRAKLPKAVPMITALLFSVATYYYTLFMKGKLFLGIDVYKFSKGRDYILSLWERYNYFSYGYGSSFEITGRYLEMDLVQMYLEVGLIAVFGFAFAYFKISDINIYAYLIMLYEFLNLLTSSSIPAPMGWTLILLTIACISSSKIDYEQIHIKEYRGKLKSLIFKKAGKRNE